jgi:hypothetical protein
MFVQSYIKQGRWSVNLIYTNLLSLANFVGRVVGFLNVLVIRLRGLLLAAALSFESEMVLQKRRRRDNRN